MNELCFRRIYAHESEALRHLRLQALESEPTAFLSTWEKEGSFTPARWQELCHKAANSNELAIFLCQGPNQKFLGMCGVQEKGRSTAEIWGVFLHPSCRGQGISQSMLRQAIDWARSRGIRELVLEVNPDLTPAVRLYNSLGFQPVGETRHCCGKKPALGFKLPL
ncbi:GNAT family N-acetyltransferase [bacterium]|nr:GNAT family N-acetyltransferase [bacterium]